MIIDAAEREGKWPLGRASTSKATSSGETASVTVRDWTERSSGRTNN